MSVRLFFTLDAEIISLMRSSSWKDVSDFLGPQVLKLFVIGVIAGISVFAVELGVAYGIQSFLSSLGLMKEELVRLPGWIPQKDLWSVLSFIMLLTAFRSVLYYFQVFIPNATYNNFGFRQRKRLLEWAFSFSNVNTPYVSTLYTERTTLSSSFINGVQYIVIYGCTSIFVMGALLYLSPILCLVSFFLMGLFLMPIYYFNSRIRLASQKFSDSWEQANRRLIVGLKNIFLIRVYGAEKEEVEKSQKSLDVYSESHRVIYKLGAIKFALPQFVGVVIICLTVYVGQTSFKVEPGILISFLYLFFRWVQNLSFIYLNAGQVVHYRPQINALFHWYMTKFVPYMQSKSTQRDVLQAERGKTFSSAIGWKTKNLSFHYFDKDPVFKNLQFQINPGATVLIRGPSGSGKTTLIGTLLAQLDNEGELLVFDKNQSFQKIENSKVPLMNSIGYAGPEPFIIEGTILENLLYANHFAPSEAEIQEALRIADCDFIQWIPEGLKFQISEQGRGLSTGQKQRISLARALLRRPKALFMDEALSNIDQKTRDSIVQKLSQLKDQMTLVFISHFEFEKIKPDVEFIFEGQGQVKIVERA